MKVKLEEIVLDWNLYPRQQVDSTHVAHIAEAMRAGQKMPPLVLDKASKRLSDGFHRYRAYQRVLSPEERVEVRAVDYTDDAALFADAVDRNAEHGRHLTTYDRLHVLAKAEEMGVEVERIASLLRMTPERIQELRATRMSGPIQSIERGRSAADKKRATEQTRRVPLKGTIRHMQGRDLSPSQAEANRRLSGMRPVFYANQLLLLINEDLLPEDDDSLWSTLQDLRDALSTLLDSERRAS